MNHQREIDELVAIILKEGASDLHISEGRRPMIRVTGFLMPLMCEPYSREDMAGILSALLRPNQMEDFKRDHEVDFSYGHANDARFRGNAYLQQGEVCVALRLIPRRIRTLAELNLPPILEQFAKRKQGFFLCVGPVGQGKSTTLASLVEIINSTRAEHIVTIEDPIEYVYEEKKSIIDQREVKIDTADFMTGLINVFRQDINVILIGEMRGTDAISTAVTAAETGHLILSTLHTNNAAQTIDRIIDSFPPTQQDQIRVQLAGSLAGIFSQRLVPRIAGGLVPAYELLVNNSAVSNLIRERRTHEINTVIETGMESGMIDMNRSLAELVRRGEITVDSAFQHSFNPKVLERML